MPHRTIVLALALLALAVPALAAPLITTPPLAPPPGGLLFCLVSNASPKKTIEVTVRIYASNGSPANSMQGLTLTPNRSIGIFAPVTQGHCVVELEKGGKRNARVSLQMHDASGTRVGAVNGE